MDKTTPFGMPRQGAGWPPVAIGEFDPLGAIRNWARRVASRPRRHASNAARTSDACPLPAPQAALSSACAAYVASVRRHPAHHLGDTCNGAGLHAQLARLLMVARGAVASGRVRSIRVHPASDGGSVIALVIARESDVRRGGQASALARARGFPFASALSALSSCTDPLADPFCLARIVATARELHLVSVSEDAVVQRSFVASQPAHTPPDAPPPWLVAARAGCEQARDVEFLRLVPDPALFSNIGPLDPGQLRETLDELGAGWPHQIDRVLALAPTDSSLTPPSLLAGRLPGTGACAHETPTTIPRSLRALPLA